MMKTGLEELEQYTLTRSQYAKRIGKTTNAVRMMMRHGKLLGEFRFDGSKFLFKDPKRPREYKGQYHGQSPPKRKINRGNHENANYPNEAFRNYNDAKKLAALKYKVDKETQELLPDAIKIAKKNKVERREKAINETKPRKHYGTPLINLSNAGYGSYYQTTSNPDRLEPSNFKPTKRPTEIKKKYYW